ncbi:FkbM family methyltransferase, partial [Planctomycetota bacterium]
MKQLIQLALIRIIHNSFCAHILRLLAKSRLIPKFIWVRWPVAHEFTVEIGPRRSFKYAACPNDVIGRHLFWRGVDDWERETISTFITLARRSSCFVDIGANTGVYSLVACSINEECVALALEPVPRVVERLKNNIAINELNDRITVYEVAASACTGNIELHVPDTDVPTSASLHPDGFRGIRGSKVRVSQIRIDDLLLTHKPPIDLVKIDVEGFEDAVLRGMEEVICRNHPTIILECNLDGPFSKVEKQLAKFGYNFFLLTDEGPQRCEKLLPDPAGANRNYLCMS